MGREQKQHVLIWSQGFSEQLYLLHILSLSASRMLMTTRTLRSHKTEGASTPESLCGGKPRADQHHSSQT